MATRAPMTQVRFRLELSTKEFLAYYQGAAGAVLARSVDGRWVRFPARVLRPYVTHAGIRGQFLLEFDADHRFRAIRKL